MAKKDKKTDADAAPKAKKQKVEQSDELKEEKKAKKAKKAAKEEAKEEAKPVKAKKEKNEKAKDGVEKKEKKEKKEKEAATAAEEAASKPEKKEKKDKEAKKDKKQVEEKPKKEKKKREPEETEGAPAKKAKKEADESAAPKAPGDTAAWSSDTGARVYLGNLPWSVTEEQIKGAFSDCGTIGNIEWLMHNDSGKFRGAVFLDFDSAASAQAAIGKNGQEMDSRAMKVEIAAPKKAPAGGGNEDNEPNESVFLGNLDWSVDEESVRAAFKDCGEVVRIKWLEKDGQFLGKAFLDFDSVESATKAVAKNGEDLLSRPMKLNFSKPRGGGGDKWGGGDGWGSQNKSYKSDKPQRTYKPAGPKPDGCVELFCGNLSYSIDENKVHEFFKDCGTVTNIRWLNDKETQEFKGIGFVSFETTEQVDKAVELAGEYCDGRQIRIDYAGQKKREGAWQGKW